MGDEWGADPVISRCRLKLSVGKDEAWLFRLPPAIQKSTGSQSLGKWAIWSLK